MRRTRLVLLAGTSALALALAACGSSSSKSSYSGTAAPKASPTSAAPTGTPIKVGLECTCSGPLASTIKDGSTVYQAWAKAVNAEGGIDGHPVQLVIKDDAGNPGISVTNLKALLGDGVIAINDLSLVDTPWASTVQQANVPVVGSITIETPFYTNSDFYPSGQTNDSTTYSLVAAAKAAGATTIGELYCAEAAVCQELGGLTKAAAVKLGLKFNYTAGASATAPNYTAQCVAAKQAGVQALVLNLSGPTDIRFARDCDAQGYDPTYVIESSGVSVDQFTSPGLDNSLWMAFSNDPFFDNDPGVKAMNAAIDKYYPGLRNSPDYSGFAEQAWGGGLLLQAAFKGAGLTSSESPTSAMIIQGLDTIKNDTLGGFTPPLTFVAGKPHPVDCWFTASVTKKVLAVANQGKVSCESGSNS